MIAATTRMLSLFPRSCVMQWYVAIFRAVLSNINSVFVRV